MKKQGKVVYTNIFFFMLPLVIDVLLFPQIYHPSILSCFGQEKKRKEKDKQVFP